MKLYNNLTRIIICCCITSISCYYYTVFITDPVIIACDVISLRHRASQLTWPIHQLITQSSAVGVLDDKSVIMLYKSTYLLLGCGPKHVKPRGCRAGQHVQQRRLQTHNQATTACGSVGTCEAEAEPKLIPVIVRNRSTVGIPQTLRSQVIVDVMQRSALSCLYESSQLMSPTFSACLPSYRDTVTQVTHPHLLVP